MLFADTDALSKLSAWDLYDEACRLLGAAPSEVCVFGAETHQIRKDRHGRWTGRLTEAGRLRALYAAESGRDDFPISDADADVLLSIKQENDAFEVDEGERVLVAGVLRHDGSILTTNDKKALRALAAEPACSDICQRLAGRVIHLDQVILLLIDDLGFETVRSRIVPLRQCDSATRAAFGGGMDTTEADVQAYFAASIADLRRDTGALLADD